MNSNRFLPRYLKFANQIQAQISAGVFMPGDKLPPQRELANQFDTTLMTIRKTIQVLEEDGVLQSEHGVGTFVVDPNLQEDQFQLFSLSSEFNRRPSGIVETKKLGVETAVINPKASQTLRQPEQTELVMLERLRTRNDVPFAYQHSYMPPKFAQVAEAYAPNDSLYEALQKTTQQGLTLAKEILLPVVLSDKQAAHLKVEAGLPAWLSQRVSTTQDGVPILYDEAILKQDSFAVTVEHTGKRTNSQLRILDDQSPDIFSFLLEDFL